VKAVCW